MSIVITATIDIEATREEAWAVLADFPSHGEWSTFSKVEGEARVGTRLSMRMPGLSFGSTVTAATPGERLEWAARIIRDGTFLGRHAFVLTGNPDGTTRLTNTETFSGALVWPFQGLFRRTGSRHENDYDGFQSSAEAAGRGHCQRSAPSFGRPLIDPFPLKWPALEYGFRAEEDGSDAEQEAQA